MCTHNQLDANRRNAQLSTGPVTEEGKKAIRSNALKHGFYSDSAVLTRVEEGEEFDDLNNDFLDHYAPQGPVELELASRIVLAVWQLRRIQNAENQSLSLDVMDAEVQLPERYKTAESCSLGYAVRADMRADHPTYLGFDRHRAHWDNIYYKAVKELARLQVGPAFPPVATGRRPVPRSAPSTAADGTAELQSGSPATPSNQTQNQEIGFVPQNSPTDPPEPVPDRSAAPEVIASPALSTANTSGMAELQSGDPATPSNQTPNQGIAFDSQSAPADLRNPAADQSVASDVNESAEAQLRAGTPAIAALKIKQKPRMPRHPVKRSAAKRAIKRANQEIGFVSQNTQTVVAFGSLEPDLESTFATESH
jgi:hypothetical protein